jgi:heme/copper-type cytochrome/quinol oxidase subunit 1
MSATVHHNLTEMWESPHTVRGWFATVDHKTLGKRYLASAFIFLLICGVRAHS